MIFHCLEAEWTSELKQAILGFDVQAALRASSEWADRTGEHILWHGAVLWLDLIFWGEQHVSVFSFIHGYIVCPNIPHFQQVLTLEETGRVHNCYQHVIQSAFSQLLISPTVVRVIAALLTWRNHIDIYDCWDGMRNVVDQHHELLGLTYGAKHLEMVSHDHIREASYLWLCKTLAVDVEMNASFFAEGSVYAELALLYAQAQEEEAHR